DAGDEDAELVLQRRQLRLGQGGEVVSGCRTGFRTGLSLLQPPALDRDEARAEALHAGVILVAGGLVDGALAAVFGLQRFDRQAVGLGAAVAASLAHHLVDDGALGGIGKFVALPAAALFRGAGLVVDQRRNARQHAQFALNRVQFVAVTHGDARRPVRAGGILFRFVGDDDDGRHALGGDLPRDDRRVERAVVVLAAGHGDRVVEQD